MNTVKNSRDRRCVKTKRAIRDAFASLAAEKDVSDITVKELSDFAMINRKTFYTHYSGVEDVLREIENELLFAFGEIIDNTDLLHDRFSPRCLFEGITELIYKNFDFYKSPLRSKLRNRFAGRVKDLLKKRLQEKFFSGVREGREKLDCALEFISAGIVSVYGQWLSSGRKQSLEDISDTIGAIALGGLKQLTADII